MTKQKDIIKELSAVVCHGVPAERLIDLICTGFEGGISYWAAFKSKKRPLGDYPFASKSADMEPYCYWYPLVAGGSVTLSDTENDEKCKILDIKSIQDGWKVFCAKHPQHLDDFLKDNEDAGTADVFIQCCVFGSVIFG